jgi:hypothetical protein
VVSSGSLFRLALLLLISALLLPVVAHVQREVSEDPLEQWADHLLSGSFLIFGVAVLLAIIEKAGIRVAGARCKICRRPIEHGKIYCRDHLREMTEKAREKYRGERGMGV